LGLSAFQEIARRRIRRGGRRNF